MIDLIRLNLNSVVVSLFVLILVWVIAFYIKAKLKKSIFNGDKSVLVSPILVASFVTLLMFVVAMFGMISQLATNNTPRSVIERDQVLEQQEKFENRNK